MTTPLIDVSDSTLAGQKTTARNSLIRQNNDVQDKVVAPVDALGYQRFYDTTSTIRQNSLSATQGQLAADNTRKAYEAQVQAAALNRQHDAALQAAIDAMNRAAASGGNIPGVSIPGTTGGGTTGTRGDFTPDSHGMLSAAQLADLMRAAGFPESAIADGLGIIRVESTNRPRAENTTNTNGTIDRGLFQINSIHASEFPGDLFDPLTNARAAFALWQRAGGSFATDWKASLFSGRFSPQPVPQPRPVTLPSSTVNTPGGVRNTIGGNALTFQGIPTSSARARAIDISRQVLNIPYVWGGNSLQTGVDCSGLVQQVYAQMGITMPRVSRDQATTGVRVSSANQLQPGDLVAFKWAGGWAGPNIVSHIAIYLGNNQIIEAAGGSAGDIRSLGAHPVQDAGAIYIHTTFPGE